MKTEDTLPEENVRGSETHIDEYVLLLYVTGASPNSSRAISNITLICETYLKGKYSLQIIDVHQETAAAEREQLIALPVLIKKSPLPQRRLIGDMSNTQIVLTALGLCN